MAQARRKARREYGSGSVRQLPSGRWQARWREEDGTRHSAPQTFDTRLDAERWLKRGDFTVPEQAPPDDPLFRDYAARWLASRDDVKPRTRTHYGWLLESALVPALGDLNLSAITPAVVRGWHAEADAGAATKRAHAYSLLREILATAVTDEILSSNPCRVKGAGHAKTKHRPRVATLEELDVLVAALPPRYRAMALLAAWCGLRFGELTELRRYDIDGLKVRVTRGVVRDQGRYVVGDPKSRAGVRTVTMPPHIEPMVADHLREHVGEGADALLFPARGDATKHLAPASLYRVFHRAREIAGRPDLHFHDLRHTGATLAAATGASLADLMVRVGHSTPAAAMRYQHAVEGRDEDIARALSGFAQQGRVHLPSA